MHFLITHLDELAEKLLQHIYLTLIAIIVAILIGVPLGIIIIRNEKLRSWVLGITSTLQTIPSLALLAFLIPFLGIGVKPTIVVLAIYALLPIVRNTYTGLSGIEEEVLEAADGLGFTASQRLFKIELPLALPVIIAGVRTSTAMTVGITTIAAFIGAGGLGDFITQGLALNDSRLILLGAIPAALLALVLDYIIAQLEQALSSRQRKTIRLKRTKLAVVSILLITFVTWSVQQWIAPFFQSQNNRVIIGSKNFTESFILADMMAELLKAKTNLNIVKKLNIGATDILQQAILNKAIDIYPEYTGTAYLTILKQRKILSAAKTFQIVKQS